MIGAATAAHNGTVLSHTPHTLDQAQAHLSSFKKSSIHEESKLIDHNHEL